VIRFYFHPTPNPAKIALFLEEAGLAYEMIPVDTSKGEQHQPSFRAINPNGGSRPSICSWFALSRSSCSTG
jgi:GSH-dependent disulfide-bond oxidoreductase